MKLNCHDRSEWVWYVTKTRKNNNVTDCIGVVYIENKTELSWLIGLGAVCDEN